MKQFPKIFILISLCVFITSCSWESSLYKKYVNDEGSVVQCLGYCKQAFDATECVTQGGIWVPEKCVVHGVDQNNGGEDENIAGTGSEMNEETCAQQDGNYFAGYCRIYTQNKCEQGGGSWVPLNYTTLDLGNGYYVWKDGDVIRCGLYDEIWQERTGECQNEEYVAILKEVLDYKLCPTYANVACTEVKWADDVEHVDHDVNVKEDNDEAASAAAEGMCSSCEVGKYRCVVGGSSECADLKSDEGHCGTCSNVCENGELCVDGECKRTWACKLPDVSCGFEDDGISPKCYDGNQFCGAVCENGELSNKGMTCVANAECRNISENNYPKFECKCIENYYPVIENGKIIQCVNPDIDSNYCGSSKEEIRDGIKNYCLDNEHCENKICVCNENHIRCNNACIHPETSSDYCGARGACSEYHEDSENYRGKICPTGSICRNNQCICDTENQYVRCLVNNEEICVHPSDVLYCGAKLPEGKTICDLNDYENCSNTQKICRYDNDLNDYTCVCPENVLTCSGECVDPMSHPRYCGVNENCEGGDVCEISEVCQDGECKTACPGGQTPCNNQCVSLDTDIHHCGECNFGCDFKNAHAVCSNASCISAACQTGYGDCNQDIVMYSFDGDEPNNDGCETHLFSDADHCGTCGNKCDYMHAVTKCQNGICVIDTCQSGYGNCDGNVPNGCETNTTNNVNHCGKCGTKCSLAKATAECKNSKCAVKSCQSGYGNCDGNANNGCEINLTNNVNHCGKCKNKCSVSCFPDKSCSAKCQSSKCCFTGQVAAKYKKSEVKCCSGYTRYKYTKKDGCSAKTHYACLKDKPGSKCWSKD